MAAHGYDLFLAHTLAFCISHNNCLPMIVVILHPSGSDLHSPYATSHPVLPFYTCFQEAA